MSRQRLVAAVGGLFLPAAMSSFAQETAEQEADIRGTIKVDVTGSNIRRIEGESGLPVQVITREELINGGVQTMQDLLERISANQSFGGSNEALGLGSSVVGFTAPSLRGLGAERTLVLLNGKRLAPYALSGGLGVDLSGIPASAIERVEILKDGASAVYGTDAIGGVINFILRKDYTGVEINGNYFATQQGGGNNWRANVTAGYGDLAKDRYNAFVTVDYFKQEPLKASQREFSKTGHLPALGIEATNPLTVPANISQTDYTSFTAYGFSDLRNPTIPYPGGATASSCPPPSTLPPPVTPFECRFDPLTIIETIPAAEKVNAVGRFTWQIHPEHQVFVEATYYRGDFIQRIAPGGVFPPAFSSDASLPPTSPFYPVAYVAGLPGGDASQPLQLFYRPLELGPRTDEAKVDQWTLVAGVQGSFEGWSYAMSGNWVRNEQTDYLTSGYVSESQFAALLHTGDVNPFAFNSPQVVDRMRATQIVGPAGNNQASNYGGDFKVSRNLIDLPAGPLALALGIEGRRESLRQSNSDAVVTGDVLSFIGDVPSLSTSYRTVWALFGEVNVPIAKTFEANVAVRFDHYSDFGGTTNPKLTLRWEPVRSLLLRAAYGTGFRAPTLSDLYQPLGTGFDGGGSFNDPVRCPVTVADIDCRETSQYPIPYQARSGGNPLLQPERSTQWNAGIVWQPTAKLSASVDYYRVEVRNLIFFIEASTIRDNYAALAPTQVVRKPPDADFPDLPGQIDYLLIQPVNFGTLMTSGFDVDLRYRAPATPLGRFTAGLNGTYVVDYMLTGGRAEDFPSGPGARGPIGAISRWRHYATLDWSLGSWAATLTNTFQNGYIEPCLFDGYGNPLDLSGCSTRRVGSYSVWDLQGRYTGYKNVTFTLGIRNLANVAPPVTNQSISFQVNFDPTYADPRGRMFYGAIRYAFQ